ncbi:MAG: cupin domain-containing protein [Woeseiaceae bacterium]|nr:cupin domain-containing protein [Woeseiaceae bacterium]
MEKRVFKAGSDGEFWTSERCFIRERINSEAIPDFSLADSRVEPGVTTELHRLSVREWYYIIEGRGLMEVGGEPAIEVGPGDTVEIPAGVSQRISNTGTDDILLQCVCLPRFTPDCYKSLECDESWERL